MWLSLFGLNRDGELCEYDELEPSGTEVAYLKEVQFLDDDSILGKGGHVKQKKN